MNLPEPECRGGYPFDQLEEALDAKSYEALVKWMWGQTMMICEGRRYNHDTREYEEACGGVAHGVVIYPRDVRRWLAGLPVID